MTIAAILLLTTILLDTPDKLEQKACDHFFNHIYGQEYNDYKVIEFQNHTDTSKYWGIVYQCDNWDETTKKQIVTSVPGKALVVNANVPEIKTKRIRKNSGRLKIYVHSNIQVGDNYFVAIATYRKLRFAEYFFVKFDKEGNIVETCKAAEII